MNETANHSVTSVIRFWSRSYRPDVVKVIFFTTTAVEENFQLDDSGILKFANVALKSCTESSVSCTKNFDKLKNIGLNNYRFTV